MGYTIKPLSSELAETFSEYLGNLDFGHAPHWSTCFCRYYHTNCSHEQWVNRTGKENKEEAIEQIEIGKMKGYLAFDGDKCIGWCNANNAHEYIRLEEEINHLVKGQKVGCIICFVIHPEYRNKGVARLLLRKAVEDFRKQGFYAVLAIPVDDKGNSEKRYRGTFNMYRECGFEEVEKHENYSLMQLKL